MGNGNSRRDSTAEIQVRLAAERTMLAWMRTGLGLMGFGFVVARFGLFLRELASTHETTTAPHAGTSLGIGVALVVLGVSVTVLAAWQHARRLRRLDQGEAFPVPRWHWGVAMAGVLAILGAGLAAYLIGVGR
jgi:putative membrane protein